MKKQLFAILLLTLLVMIPQIQSRSAIIKTIEISSDTTTLYVGGNGPNNYTRIQDAIDNASNGDTVFVYDDASPYKENIFINKSIQLIGEKQQSTCINGRQGNVIWVEHSNVTIQQFTLQLYGSQYWAVAVQLLHAPNKQVSNIHISNCTMTAAPVLFNNATNCSLKNCHLKDNDCLSILITGKSENILIDNCNIHDMGHVDEYGWTHPGDVRIDDDCTAIQIRNCHISDITGWGIRVDIADHVTIANNSIHHTTWEGIKLYDSENVTIQHNSISENAMDGILMRRAFNVSVYDNIIIQNGNSIGPHSGIHIKECHGDIHVYHNYLRHNNPTGVSAGSTPKILLYENTFLLCEDSIVLSKCPDSSIVRNNFILCDYPTGPNHPERLYILSNDSHKHHWGGNFWYRPRILPKPVWGHMVINETWHDHVELDLRPALLPIRWGDKPIRIIDIILPIPDTTGNCQRRPPINYKHITNEPDENRTNRISNICDDTTIYCLEQRSYESMSQKRMDK